MFRRISLPAMVFFAVATALAQKSEIKGIVVDSEGAVIANAYVLIRTDALDREHHDAYQLELRTNKQGEFVATVPSGFFDVFVGAVGFTPYCQKVRTHEGAPQNIQAKLKFDPLFVKEYGDRFDAEPPRVEHQR